MNGKVGMFPNNFVELLPPEEEDKVNTAIISFIDCTLRVLKG